MTIKYLLRTVGYIISQIRYSLVVTFELNSVPGVQHKDVMIIDDEKYQQE